MDKPKVGLQLIVYGARPQEDLPGVLREVSEAGYQGIEAGTNLADVPVQEAKALLGSAGLALAGIHGGYAQMGDPAKVDQFIAFFKEMNSRYLICSGVAEGEGIERFEKAAPTFNQAGEQCQKAGIVFCYHNHAWEFEEFDGVKGIHRLTELTDPNLVKLCVDVYWVTIGGEKPEEFIQRYQDRAIYYHFKDGAPGSFIELGQGTVDLPVATKAALACNPEWIVCEQDKTEKEPQQSITESRQYMREKLDL